ncbi:MAG TPA: hypothetical protein VHE81_06510 [Lacipirellulaceae bacterium]|nr:hypothetical protein [Lacipirellulaceae bacterium]
MTDADPFAKFANSATSSTPDDPNDPFAKFVTSPAPEPQVGGLEAGVRGAGQGLSFGFSDEAEAAARAAYYRAMGDKRAYGDIYDQELNNSRARNAAASSQHPWWYHGGELAGIVAVPGGLEKAGLESATSAAIRAGQPLGRVIQAGAKEGALYGGLYGTGTSEGGVENRVAGGLGGAAVGATVGAAAPPLVEAAASGINNYIVPQINAVRRPAYEAARRIVNAQDSDIAASRAADAAYGQPASAQRQIDAQTLVAQGRAGEELRNIDNPDLGFSSANLTALARSAANQSPEARDVLNRMVNDRFAGQADRATAFLRNLVATPGNAAETREALVDAARRANRPLYDAAREAGDRPIWSPTIERMSGSPMFRQAMKNAVTKGQDRAIADGYGAFNPGVAFDDSGMFKFTRGPNGVPTYPNLQYWDYVKRELDELGSSAATGGQRETSGLARQFARQLRGELDNAVPQYRQARGVAAQFFGADNALEAGETYATQNFSNNVTRRAVAQMTPAEMQAFQEGFVSRYLERVNRTGDRQNLVNRIANSPAEREKLEIALGPQNARELEAFLHLESIMDQPRMAMGNSTTARQLVELGLAGGAGTLNTHGNPLSDPAGFLTGALIGYGAARGVRAVDQRLARQIAEMLVSRDPNLVQSALSQVAHHPRMLQSLRRASSQISGRAIPGAVSGTTAAQTALPRLPGYDENDSLTSQ